MSRRGEKRVGAGREKSLSFTKITKEMNQQWPTNNHYINSESLWKRLHKFGKSSFISRPWTFDNDSCRLRVISHLYWWSNSEVFVDVWLSLDKSIGECSMVYRKMSALVWLRVYNHDFGLWLVQLYKNCLSILTFCFTSVSCDMQISYEMVSNAHVHQLTVSL